MAVAVARLQATTLINVSPFLTSVNPHLWLPATFSS
jgi:hypothetical protein